MDILPYMGWIEEKLKAEHLIADDIWVTTKESITAVAMIIVI